MEHRTSSTFEGATNSNLNEMSLKNSEMATGEDDDFETDTLVDSPICITLSSGSAYTKHRSRITVHTCPQTEVT